MDCQDDAGNTFIGYSAQLSWKKMYLTYSSILINRNNGKSFVKSTLSKLNNPFFEKNELIWKPEKYIEEGRWKNLDSPIGQKLLDSKGGYINWNCTQPKAEAQVNIDDRIMFKGLGYSEFMEMTVQPWQLPINTLKWGRFLSKTDTVVWIQWRGEKNLDIFYHNGILVEDSHIHNDEIRLDHGNLVLSFIESVELRRGYLAKTAMSRFPLMRAIFPKAVLNTHESKWKSKSLLKKADGSFATGWSIHETVKFGA